MNTHTSYWISRLYLTSVTAAQLSQIWKWCKESNRCFCKIENLAYVEINERNFRSPQPRGNYNDILGIYFTAPLPVKSQERHGASNHRQLNFFVQQHVANSKENIKPIGMVFFKDRNPYRSHFISDNVHIYMCIYMHIYVCVCVCVPTLPCREITCYKSKKALILYNGSSARCWDFLICLYIYTYIYIYIYVWLLIVWQLRCQPIKGWV